MKIVEIETFRPAQQPNLVFLRLRTDTGLDGLGEAFFSADAVERFVHTSVAGVLFALEDANPERAGAALRPSVGYQGGGIETRANGAVDMALWDLLGKQAQLPVARLLGGPVRDRARIYNTCAGPGYVSSSSYQNQANWGVGRGRYEDLQRFLSAPGELARELRDEGITAMKVWPFDAAAEATGGTDIPREELDRAVRVVAEIRDAVGLDLDVMVELHGKWNLLSAVKICRALAPLQPAWIEDPIRNDAVDALARLAGETELPIAVGETCVGRQSFLTLLQSGVADIVTCDVQWTGGLTEAHKIAALADTFAVPIAPHDCTGPVTFAACCHLTCSAPNGFIQETVRAFLRTWYREFVDGLPHIDGGYLTLGEEPGLGVTLKPAAESAMRRTRSAR